MVSVILFEVQIYIDKGDTNMPIIEVIKYNGGPDVFAWKFPNEELGTWTQLIVNESQEVAFVKGGQVLDILGPGRHTLDTANIPILTNLIKIPFGGRSPFSAEVWYINQVHSMDIKWGTPTPIQLQDPEYNLFLPVSAFGQFGIQVTNSKKFLIKLVGTVPVFDKNSVVQFFRGLYLTEAKDAIATYIIKKNISVLKINAHLTEISAYLKESIQPKLEEYGLTLLNFFVKSINVPEDDLAVRQLKAALAKRAEMDIIGFDYVQERSFDAMEGAANNSGTMGGAMGAGMGFSMGTTMGQQMGVMAQSMNVNPAKTCPFCNRRLDSDARFCPACGKDTMPPAPVMPMQVAPASVSMGVGGAPCPRCGTLVAGSSKFCTECGGSMVRACAGCGKPIEGNPKFCPECGKPTI